MASLSIHRPRLMAEMIPTGMPTSSQTTRAAGERGSVAGRRSKICDLTETLFW